MWGLDIDCEDSDEMERSSSLRGTCRAGLEVVTAMLWMPRKMVGTMNIILCTVVDGGG